MPFGNIQNATRSFISNMELICAPVSRFPCIAIHSSTQALRSNDFTSIAVPFICSTVSTALGTVIVSFSTEALSLPLPVGLPISLLSGAGLGLLSGGVSLYCVRKVNAHQASPDPSSDSEIMLSEMAECTTKNDVVINIEDIEQG